MHQRVLGSAWLLLGLQLLASLLFGCGPQVPALTPEEAKITVSEAPAPQGYVQVAALSAKSGSGCGVLGHAGSREDAERKLRSAAARVHASYVRLTSYEPPRLNHECVEHEHKLNGVAYGPAPARTAPAAGTSPSTTSR